MFPSLSKAAVLALGLLLAGVFFPGTAQAWAPCRGQPQLSVIYPSCGPTHARSNEDPATCAKVWTTIPRDGRIVLRYNLRRPLPKLSLVERKRGKVVPIRLVTEPGGTWVQVVPVQTLRRNRRYELRSGKVTVLRLKVGRNRPKPRVSVPLSATVKFTKAHVAPPRRKPGPFSSRTGRASWVTLHPATGVVAATVTGVFLGPDKRAQPLKVFRRYYGAPYAVKGVWIADNGNGCYVPWPAPNQGTYRLKIVPWFAPGVRGKPVTVTGKIR